MISAVFVDRPRLAIVIAILTTLAGMLSLLRIPVAQFPDIVPPQVTISTSYAGASAAVVVATLATGSGLMTVSVGGAVSAPVTTPAVAPAVAVVVSGATEVSAVAGSKATVEPAEVSAARTSAAFMSRGSSAWNERVRNRPPPVLDWDNDFDADGLGRRCHENNLRIVSPLKTK